MDRRAQLAVPGLAVLSLLASTPSSFAETQVSAECGVAAAGSITVGGSIWIDCTPKKLLDLMNEQQTFRDSNLERIGKIAEELGVSNCRAEEMVAAVAREAPPAGEIATRLAKLAAERRSPAADRDTADESAIVSDGSIEIPGHLIVGLPPEELDDLMQHVRSVDDKYLARVEHLGRTLGFTRCATATFLAILGEKRVPPEQLSTKLTKIANRHVELIAQLRALTTEDPDIEALRRQAATYIDDGDYDAAEQQLLQAREILAKKSKEASPFMRDYARVEADLGRLDLTRLRYESAAQFFVRAAEHASVAGSPGDRARQLELAGGAFQDAGLYSKAEAVYEEAREWRIANPEESPAEETITTLNNMGGLHFSQSDYANAIEKFAQALEAAQSDGSVDADVQALLEAASHSGLADANVAMSEYDTAEEHYSQALSLMELVYGTGDPSLVPTITNWAWLKTGRGEYACAESLFLRARAISGARGNARGLEAAATENNLAALYYKMGKHDEAEKLWTDAKEIYDSQLGEDHPVSLVVSQNIARALRKKGDLAGAEHIYNHALAVWEKNAKKKKQVEKTHLVIASLHAGLGDLYVAQDRLDKAEKKYDKAISLAESQLDEDEVVENSLVIANFEHDLAVVYEKQGEYEDAMEHGEKALKIMASQLREDHPDLGTATSTVARVLMRLERLDEAIPLYLKAIEIAEQLQRPLQVASRSRRLAAVYKDLGRLDDARHRLETAQDIYANLDPTRAAKYATTREAVGRELSELGEGAER